MLSKMRNSKEKGEAQDAVAPATPALVAAPATPVPTFAPNTPAAAPVSPAMEIAPVMLDGQ